MFAGIQVRAILKQLVFPQRITQANLESLGIVCYQKAIDDVREKVIAIRTDVRKHRTDMNEFWSGKSNALDDVLEKLLELK